MQSREVNKDRKEIKEKSALQDIVQDIEHEANKILDNTEKMQSIQKPLEEMKKSLGWFDGFKV